MMGMTLDEYLKLPGNTCAGLGDKVGMSAGSISRIAKGYQNISLAQARRIELETGGAVTVAELKVPSAA